MCSGGEKHDPLPAGKGPVEKHTSGVSGRPAQAGKFQKCL